MVCSGFGGGCSVDLLLVTSFVAWSLVPSLRAQLIVAFKRIEMMKVVMVMVVEATFERRCAV